MRDAVLAHLEALVGFDTRNPPRAIRADDGLVAYLAGHLPGFEIAIDDHGDGCVALYAVRGNPDLMFNFHVDTVPAAPGWTRDPLQLAVDGQRATGLGACDIKGAAACMLAAVERTDGPVALLFTSDEEAGSSRCIREFLAGGPRHDRVVVAEPTGCRAVLEHRGIVSARGTFAGETGHASGAGARRGSAIHRAAQWVVDAQVIVGTLDNESRGPLRGLPFNVGRIEGGHKPNMIAAHCELAFGFRPLPGQDVDGLMSRFASTLPAGASFEVVFEGPSLADDDDGRGRALADRLGARTGPPVSFWTEASLFSAAGAAAIVIGPGDIDQAHTADEWVALAQLDTMADFYRRVLSDGRRS